MSTVALRHYFFSNLVLGERHLRRLLASYFDYYHRFRTHLSLNKDAPVSRRGPQSGFGERQAYQLTI